MTTKELSSFSFNQGSVLLSLLSSTMIQKKLKVIFYAYAVYQIGPGGFVKGKIHWEAASLVQDNIYMFYLWLLLTRELENGLS